jgi:hypothetical protein
MRKNDGRASVNFLNQRSPKAAHRVRRRPQTRSLWRGRSDPGLYLLGRREHLPVNIGNPDHEVTMLELAQTVIRDRLDERDRRALPTDDPVRRPDITRTGDLGVSRDRPRRGPAPLVDGAWAGTGLRLMLRWLQSSSL